MRVLGYTEISLDNVSGEEQQPWSSIKYWASLTDTEKEAATILGYTETTWGSRSDSGSGLPPQSWYKYWDELTTCGEGENARIKANMFLTLSRISF